MEADGDCRPQEQVCFIHASDLWLDALLRGVVGATTALRTALRNASLLAWRLVQLATARDAALVLATGGLFDALPPGDVRTRVERVPVAGDHREHGEASRPVQAGEVTEPTGGGADGAVAIAAMLPGGSAAVTLRSCETGTTARDPRRRDRIESTLSELIDIERLERSLPELAAAYGAATPFPHIVLDDVVLPGPLKAAYAEFDAIDGDTWRKYLHVNERKYANTDLTSWGPVLQGLAEAFASKRFVRFLGRLSGFEDLQPDLTMDGGGLHHSRAGGYLNVHADFTTHHVRQTWRRRVNLLLYLNPVWDPAWGGELELWSKDMERCEARVAPRGNRILLFSTGEHSYHGHPDPLACPIDVARRSLALYYFTEDADPLVRATDYRSRPGDGLKSAAIFLDKQMLRAYDVAKRRLRLSDDTASRWLGALDRFRPGRRRGSAPTEGS